MTAQRFDRRPRGGGWSETTVAPSVKAQAPITRGWTYGKISVLSSIVDAELPDGAGVGPQRHISITRAGRRPSESDVRKALRSFGMVGTEEDNHHQGAARHFWLPCDPAHRVDCQCKVDEKNVVEPDGYRWTTSLDESQCRGCEFQRMTGKVCSMHGSTG